MFPSWTPAEKVVSPLYVTIDNNAASNIAASKQTGFLQVSTSDAFTAG